MRKTNGSVVYIVILCLATAITGAYQPVLDFMDLSPLFFSNNMPIRWYEYLYPLLVGILVAAVLLLSDHQKWRIVLSGLFALVNTAITLIICSYNPVPAYPSQLTAVFAALFVAFLIQNRRKAKRSSEPVSSKHSGGAILLCLVLLLITAASAANELIPMTVRGRNWMLYHTYLRTGQTIWLFVLGILIALLLFVPATMKQKAIVYGVFAVINAALYLFLCYISYVWVPTDTMQLMGLFTVLANAYLLQSRTGAKTQASPLCQFSPTVV